MTGHHEKPHDDNRDEHRDDDCNASTEVCEEMAELLSARLDGELGDDEAALLDEHLLACDSCRELAVRLEAVDATAALVAIEPRPGLEEELEARVARTLKPGPMAKTGPLARLAVAALVIIALSMVILVTSDRAGADGVAGHVAALEKINYQAIGEQDTILDTLALDLNAMKLKVSFADIDKENADALLARIDDLLGAVDRVRLDETNGKGEEK
jgi:hypothetical protein